MQKKIKKLADLVWPPFCIGCQKSTENFDSQVNTYLCPQCQEKLRTKRRESCAICNNDKGVKYNFCPQCSHELEIEGLIKGGSYRNPILKKAIHSFKYKGIRNLSLPLSALVAESLKNFFQKRKSEHKYKSSLDWALVPVPLSALKKRKRGYNQAEIIAKRLQKIFAIPLKTDIIKKDRHTRPQMEIRKAQQRKENLKNAFSLHSMNKRNLDKRKIILIDDVTTTGTTLKECAKVLNPFVEECWAAVIAA